MVNFLLSVRWPTKGCPAAGQAASGRHLAGILLVGDVLEPDDMLAVERFLEGNVNHLAVRSGAVPVLLVRREPHRVARPDLADRAAPGLHQPGSGNDRQGLAERMGVPSGPGARLEGHARGPDSRRR